MAEARETDTIQFVRIGDRNSSPLWRNGKVFIITRQSSLVSELERTFAEQLTICGQSDTAEEAVAAVARLKPDVALADISSVQRSGVDLVTTLRAARPTMKLLVRSTASHAEYATEILKAGADGYLLATETPEEITLALTDVLNGHLYVSPGVLESGI
jgi:DNA-binding NarL/FixJ family response regulator